MRPAQLESAGRGQHRGGFRRRRSSLSTSTSGMKRRSGAFEIVDHNCGHARAMNNPTPTNRLTKAFHEKSKSLFGNYEGRCFRGKDRMARRDEGGAARGHGGAAPKAFASRAKPDGLFRENPPASGPFFPGRR